MTRLLIQSRTAICELEEKLLLGQQTVDQTCTEHEREKEQWEMDNKQLQRDRQLELAQKDQELAKALVAWEKRLQVVTREAAAEKAALQAQIAKSEADRKLQEDLSLSRESDLQDQLCALDHECKARDRELQELRNRAKEYEKDLQEKDRRLRALEQQLLQSRQDHADQERSHQQSLDNLASKVAHLSAACDQQVEEVDRQMYENHHLKSDLQEARTRVDQLNSELAHTEGERSVLESALEHEVFSQSTLQSSMTTLRKAVTGAIYKVEALVVTSDRHTTVVLQSILKDLRGAVALEKGSPQHGSCITSQADDWVSGTAPRGTAAKKVDHETSCQDSGSLFGPRVKQTVKELQADVYRLQEQVLRAGDRGGTPTKTRALLPPRSSFTTRSPSKVGPSQRLDDGGALGQSMKHLLEHVHDEDDMRPAHQRRQVNNMETPAPAGSYLPPPLCTDHLIQVAREQLRASGSPYKAKQVLSARGL